MTLVHAWFSPEQALLRGSCVYRKPSGSTVNVTRVNPLRDDKGSHRQDEKYVGQVVPDGEGGCVQPNVRVNGITRF